MTSPVPLQPPETRPEAASPGPFSDILAVRPDRLDDVGRRLRLDR